ncbi:MAG TPA: carbamoyltransferase C-terminal domain-containing protein [Vicinamibacterales bacterium]|nr:carbamoyltransferase C-terminal domain-containing protein [Vicinamibacterales bacterium]
MLILGFNAYHGDVAAALLRDGELVAALEEERFQRMKHVAGFPALAMRKCLEIGGVKAQDVDIFAVARGRRAHFWRRAAFAIRHRPGAALWRQYRSSGGRQHSLPRTIAEALGLEESHVTRRLRHIEHHPTHLASAFFASGFDEAACCAIDGFGDFVSVSAARGRGSALDVVHRTFFPHSLGLLYLAVTQFLGFDNWGDEYKVMGLAPYGQPNDVDAVRRLLRLERHGHFTLDLRYFRHWTGEVPMEWSEGVPRVAATYSSEMEGLLGPPRASADPVEQRHMDLAASLQVVFEEGVFHVLRGVHSRIGGSRLALAGGCAMNSVANGKIRANTPFRDLYVQPAAGDNGTALGAALYAWYAQEGGARGWRMEHAYWGTSFSDDQVAEAMVAADSAVRDRCRVSRPASEALSGIVSAHLADGLIVGWFQGRMEWGARALGNRSILADPRRVDMRDIINAKIKFRERFRPFAPAVLEEEIDNYFVGAVADPFMLQVYPVRPDKRALLPAVTHVDGSGRLQSVNRTANPAFWTLIRAFGDRTGVPVLLNTSFNENEPIVEQPSQALDCFLRTDMDVLVMGSHLLVKNSVRTCHA